MRGEDAGYLLFSDYSYSVYAVAIVISALNPIARRINPDRVGS
jgi:hypothetical protein